MQLARIVSQSHMATPLDEVLANIRANVHRGLPEFHLSHYWQKFKGDTAMAIVGGGPSLPHTIEHLRSFRHVMVCGSAHDFVVRKGIEPEFAAVLDPHPDVTKLYLQNPCPTTTYLVSSNCHASVFEALKHNQVLLWHCAGTVPEDVRPPAACIGGGCTVTLRAIGLALLMGYGNQHFFGFDSCCANGQQYAYMRAEGDTIPDEPTVDVRLMGSDRVYYCTGTNLAQAQQFQDILRSHGQFFTPTVYGDGLIAEILRIGRLEAQSREAA